LHFVGYYNIILY